MRGEAIAGRIGMPRWLGTKRQQHDSGQPGRTLNALNRRGIKGLLLATLLFLGMVATGCMEMDTGAEVNDDGSGTIHMTMTLDPMLSSFMLMEGGIEGAMDGMEDAPEVGSELSEGTTVTRFDMEEQDGRVVFTLEGEFADPEALNVVMTSEAEGEALFEEFTLVDSGSEWEFDAVPGPGFAADMLEGSENPDDGGSDSEGSEEDFGEFGEFMEGAMTPPEVNFSMTFPGDVQGSNATTVDGNTATWDLTDTSITDLTASAGPAGFPTTLVAGVVGGLLVVALLAWFFINRSRRVSPATVAVNPGVGYPAAPYAPGSNTAGMQTIPTARPPVPPTADVWADERTAPAATPMPPAGWYPDPKGEAKSRYWDGSGWTEHVAG